MKNFDEEFTVTSAKISRETIENTRFLGLEGEEDIHNAHFCESARYMMKLMGKRICFENHKPPELEINMRKSPFLKYDDGANISKTAFHWGQRKLLMSEIIFLMDYGVKYPEISLIIYAGSAAGMHIPFLRSIFSHKKKYGFILIDPARFSERILEEERRQEKINRNKKNIPLSDIFDVRREFMTDKLARDFKTKYKGEFFFISDIRIEPNEEAVTKDMVSQQEWIKIMKPQASLLKFRLPWKVPKKGFKYLKSNKLYFQLYALPNSSETRMVVDRADKFKEVKWDVDRYNDICFHFNVITRKQQYRHNINIEGVCHCFDCTAEILIWGKFMRFHEFRENDDDIIKFINGATENCSDMYVSLSSHKKYLSSLSLKNLVPYFVGTFDEAKTLSRLICREKITSSVIWYEIQEMEKLRGRGSNLGTIVRPNEKEKEEEMKEKEEEELREKEEEEMREEEERKEEEKEERKEERKEMREKAKKKEMREKAKKKEMREKAKKKEKETIKGGKLREKNRAKKHLKEIRKIKDSKIRIEERRKYFLENLIQNPGNTLGKIDGSLRYDRVIHNMTFSQTFDYILKKHKKRICFEMNELPYLEVNNKARIPYETHTALSRNNFHWGQRKLLMSEIMFLMDYGLKYPKVKTIIYVGGANGQHIPFLRRLFEGYRKYNFILIDPAPFSVEVKEETRKEDGFTYMRELMTDEMAEDYWEEFKGECFFISDIRTISDDERVLEDMKLQSNWVKIMKPRASLLKFRLSWEKEKQIYLSPSKHYLQIWAPGNSTETRLAVDVSDSFKEMEWNTYEYEDICFYQNTVYRKQFFPHKIEGVEGLCHCFDCSAEIAVWYKFCSFIGKRAIPEVIAALIDKTTSVLMRDGRTIWDKYISADPKEKSYVEFLINHKNFMKKIEKRKETIKEMGCEKTLYILSEDEEKEKEKEEKKKKEKKEEKPKKKEEKPKKKEEKPKKKEEKPKKKEEKPKKKEEKPKKKEEKPKKKEEKPKKK